MKELLIVVIVGCAGIAIATVVYILTRRRKVRKYGTGYADDDRGYMGYGGGTRGK